MRMSGWRLALLAGAVFSVLALGAACGDDESEDDAEATEPTNTAQGGATDDEETPAATDAPDDGGDDEDVIERLRQAASNTPDTFYYSYEVEYDAELDEEDYSGTLTLGRSGDKELFSIKLNEAEGESELTLITGPDSTITCQVEAGDGAEPLCIEVAGAGGAFADLAGLFVTADEVLGEFVAEDGARATKAGAKRIAGLDTQCYDVSDNTGKGTVCIAEDENIMASIDGEFEGAKTKFTLVEYDSDPDDSVFEPPYEVMGS